MGDSVHHERWTLEAKTRLPHCRDCLAGSQPLRASDWLSRCEAADGATECRPFRCAASLRSTDAASHTGGPLVTLPLQILLPRLTAVALAAAVRISSCRSPRLRSRLQPLASQPSEDSMTQTRHLQLLWTTSPASVGVSQTTALPAAAQTTLRLWRTAATSTRDSSPPVCSPPSPPPPLSLLPLVRRWLRTGCSGSESALCTSSIHIPRPA